jgi:hypothetical protein
MATPVVLVTGLLLIGATAFTLSPVNHLRKTSWLSLPTREQKQPRFVMFSSVGDGGDGGGNDRDENDLGDFLDPMKKPDSEDMKRARQYMSETSLPISFDDSLGGATEGTADADEEESDAEMADADLMDKEGVGAPASDSSSLVSSSSSSSESPLGGNATSSALFGGNSGGSDAENKGPSPTLLTKNPYMQVVSKISPSDLIAKFTAESDPRVQEAVRTTILGLIGSLPKLAFETTSVTTGQRLASLVRKIEMRSMMHTWDQRTIAT